MARSTQEAFHVVQGHADLPQCVHIGASVDSAREESYAVSSHAGLAAPEDFAKPRGSSHLFLFVTKLEVAIAQEKRRYSQYIRVLLISASCARRRRRVSLYPCPVLELPRDSSMLDTRSMEGVGNRLTPGLRSCWKDFQVGVTPMLCAISWSWSSRRP